MVLELIKRSWWTYLIELVIAIILIAIRLEVFLVYAFFSIVFKIDMATDYLRKLIRVFQVTNEGKLRGIIRKLNISDEELQELGDEVENSLTDEQRKSLYKDMDDLGLK